MNVFYMKQFINHRLKSCYILAGFIGLLPCSANAVSSGIPSPETTRSSQQIAVSSITSRLKPYAPYIGAGLAAAGIGGITGYGFARYIAKQDDNHKVESFTRLASDNCFYFFRETRLRRLYPKLTIPEKLNLFETGTNNIHQALIRCAPASSNPLDSGPNPHTAVGSAAHPGPQGDSANPVDQTVIQVSQQNGHASAAHSSGSSTPQQSAMHRLSFRIGHLSIGNVTPDDVIRNINSCASRGVFEGEREAFFSSDDALQIALTHKEISVNAISAFFPNGDGARQEYMQRIFDLLNKNNLRYHRRYQWFGKVRELCRKLQIRPQQQDLATPAASSSSSSNNGYFFKVFSSHDRQLYLHAEEELLETIRLCEFRGITSAEREAFFRGSVALRTALNSDSLSIAEIATLFPHDQQEKEHCFLQILHHMARDLGSTTDDKIVALAETLDINIWQIHPHVRGLEVHRGLVGNFIESNSNLTNREELIELARYLANAICSRSGHHPGYHLGMLEKCLCKLDDADYHGILLDRNNEGEVIFYTYTLKKLIQISEYLPDFQLSEEINTFAKICSKINLQEFNALLSRMKNDQQFIDATWSAARKLPLLIETQIANTRLNEILAICEDKKREVQDIWQQCTGELPKEIFSTHETYRDALLYVLEETLKTCNADTLAGKRDLLLRIIRCIGDPKTLNCSAKIVNTFNRLRTIGIKPNVLLYPNSADNRTFFQYYVMTLTSKQMLDALLIPLCKLLTDVEFDDEMAYLQATLYFKKWYERNKDWLQEHPATNAAIDRLIIAGENSLRLQQSVVSMLLQALEQPSSNAATSSAEQG